MINEVIKLNDSDISFLKEVCSIDILNNYPSKCIYNETQHVWNLHLDNSEIDSIQDDVLIALTEKGTTNSEINSIGISIDNYLDIFNPHH